MTEINNIDYSSWNNAKLVKIAQQVDKDGIKGLSKEELFEFMQLAADNKIEKAEIYETMGISLHTNKHNMEQDTRFNEAVDFYNAKMSDAQRSEVTTLTYNNLEAGLYEMEKAIDNAFIDCDAYKDIVIVPRWHYRFYPNFNDRLINFDIEEIRNTTSKDMNALHELKDKIEYIIEKANGETTHNEPQKTEYDIEALAQKHLGMSYEEFTSMYKDELEFCKTVTPADFSAMTETQRMVYRKAKAYASEMLQTTINEAHTVNWDASERKVEETMNATDNMLVISDFETDGINQENLGEIKSGILYKAFEEALIQKYQEFNPSGVENIQTDNPEQKTRKQIVNGVLMIFKPDGTVYDSSGRRIK